MTKWVEMPLGELITFTRSAPRGPDGGEVRFIPMDLIPRNGRQEVGFETRHRREVASGVYCEPGDILLSKITPCFENGKIGRVPLEESSTWFASTEVFPIKAGSRIDPNFLWFVLSDPSLRSELAPKMQGATGRQRLPRAALEAHLISLPPIEEQRAIAEVLTTVQRAIQVTERVIAATRELKKSLARHLFTYGPVSIHDVPNVKLKESEIGAIPEHWSVATVGECIAQAQYGLSIRGSSTGRVPILRMNNQHDGRIRARALQYVDLPERDEIAFALQPGDLLFNRTNSIEHVGRTAIFDLPGKFVFASYLIRLRVSPEVADPHFLNWYLNWNETQARLKLIAQKAVSQANISASRLRMFIVPLPPFVEQRIIASLLERVRQKEEAERSQLAVLERTLQSLLHNLMTGQTRIPPFGAPTKK